MTYGGAFVAAVSHKLDNTKLVNNLIEARLSSPAPTPPPAAASCFNEKADARGEQTSRRKRRCSSAPRTAA